MNVLDVEEGSRWRWMEMLSMMVTMLVMALDQNQCRKTFIEYCLPNVIPSSPMNLSPKFFLSIVKKNCLPVVMVSSSWRQLTMMY